jgi:hypothetical protein
MTRTATVTSELRDDPELAARIEKIEAEAARGVRSSWGAPSVCGAYVVNVPQALNAIIENFKNMFSRSSPFTLRSVQLGPRGGRSAPQTLRATLNVEGQRGDGGKGGYFPSKSLLISKLGSYCCGASRSYS